MTTSQKYHNPKLAVGHSDTEWLTPAVSEKFQSRFGWRPNTLDGGDTGLGNSDHTEDICSTSSSPSFQPIRSQIPIPTAHVMPSTAGTLASKLKPRASEEARGSSSSSSSKSSLPKSASSPNLDAQHDGNLDTTSVKPDCLSRYRSLVNGLDHSLFPSGDQTRLDEAQKFEVPTMEPTLNQSALLGGLCHDVRQQLQMTGLGDNTGLLEQTYKVLPEARAGLTCPVDPYGQRNVHPGSGASARMFSVPQGLQTQALLRDQTCSGGYDPLPQERCGELASWQQQKQKLESLRLQVEQMQLMTGGSGQYSSLYPTASHIESSKWDAVIKANENLLKEKELTIERQKQQMSQLEQRLRESELQVHSALMGRGAPYTDVCLLRLQEAQRENAFLRAQFAERNDCFTKEKLEADRRLGAVEAETQRLNEVLKESSEKHAEELKKQEERIRSRDKHISSLKKKCQKESEQNREKQQRIETLERYLADLPTMEDYQAQHKKLEEAEERTALLQATIRDLEANLEEARSAVRNKETQLEEQRHRERELLTTVTSLQNRVQESLEDGVRLPSLDVEKLREENTTMKEEHQRLKKVIEKQLRIMEQLGSQIRTLEEQLSQEECSSQALREEVAEKEESLLQLHIAMKELSAQNQELMEHNLTLQERLQGEEAPSGHSLLPMGARLTQKLYGEMAACLCDLRSLCNVLTQRAQGHDPNLSMLLGIASAPPPVGEQWEDWLSPEGLQKKLQEAQQLRRDVEELRTTVSDRYAQDMGENCITQ
ncbi:centrosomal protein of 85 kDa isoform X1 [Puntigrus tetrazona]|uniref:centrosomal protein of 85 kDa isoform X1 n=1 Tax=Puntigrus tetrazona TaxID=1606681 RepID=UPI001C899504|nr:centrosomal protein of 85 kDa isoform X1 [Puntigrus tetrazona]XP_043116643.1 centrosomal protein of 85 kDa isoform X1 [Puntigrus tetrazona]